MKRNTKFQKFRISLFLLIPIAILLFTAVSLSSEILSSRDLVITFHKDERKVAEKILSQFSEIVESVNREVGFYPDSSFAALSILRSTTKDERRTDISGKVKLILCHNKKDFKEYILKFRNLPENSEAFAVSQKALIIIRNPRDMQINTDFFRVLTHEYNHILLHTIAADVNIPLWFDEGFAQYFAKQWDIRREFIFVRNGIIGNLLDLNVYNNRYPEFQDRVEIFYLQSYYTIKYLINRFSKEKFQDFLDALQTSKDFDRTFFDIFEISLYRFIVDARKSIKTHTILTIFYSGFGLLWTIIPILVLIAYVRKKMLGKKVEEIWDREEESDDNL
ncbi:MAG: hypothetical protein J7J77_03670 [Candidatus Cloacimonetes bacterium]|nr:hypothetical protein [Candidatus Cloacimonadota bacterium]